MSSHCAYSFADLYRAAYGGEPTREQLQELYALAQEQRNAVVREWVKRAGWETVDVRGTDGEVYASFGPKGSAACA
ncbi:MAG: hypothetical protein IPH10_13950 [bacterium]|nr:hypothetical protein [bacterium]